MDIMTIPATPWASLPSYAPSIAGPADCVQGGTNGGFEIDGDAATTQFGAGFVRHAAPDLNIKSIRNKDNRPGSRAWSPPV